MQVGLDFGTSCTKVVFRPMVSDRGCRTLHFDHELDFLPSFALPSVADIDESGRLLLGVSAAKRLSGRPWTEGLRRLKVAVAGQHSTSPAFQEAASGFKAYVATKGVGETPTAEETAALFLAYAMREARLRIEQATDFKGSRLNLIFNVCLPIDHIESNTILNRFLHILAWAELIELSWRPQGPPTDILEGARLLEESADYGLENRKVLTRLNSDARVFAVPEGVAEVYAYQRSSSMRRGIQALIDFGAGTTDVSVFEIARSARNPSEFVSRWLASENVPLGIDHVARAISSAEVGDTSGDAWSSSGIASRLRELERPEDISLDSSKAIVQALDDIWEETRSVWRKAYGKYRRQGMWEDVPVFVSGGGARLWGLDRVFAKPWWDQIRSSYRVTPLPAPPDYDEGSSGAPFQRMTVAYGLAWSPLEYPEYSLPADCTDATPPRLPVTKYGESDGSGLLPTESWFG